MIELRGNRFAGLLILLFFVLVLSYAYFEGRNLIQGPVIHLQSPAEVFTSKEQKVAIQGTAERIVELRLNGRPVPLTETGDFYEETLLSPGYNRVSLVARDKAGRETARDIQVVYEPETPTTLPEPSTTQTALPIELEE